MLVDNHGREMNYMRLAVTDRCNLRCFYCMPESGIKFLPRKDLLSFEEMYRMIHAFGKQGISKLRITGGEPFIRKGMTDFLSEVSKNPHIQNLSITTNGTFTSDKVEAMEKMGIHSVNLSLDSLDKQRFLEITRRDLYDQVMSTFDALTQSSLTTKVNMVVMEGKNIEDIYPMIELTRHQNVAVRFIEEMPFNGTQGQGNASFWPMKKILEHIQKEYAIDKVIDPDSSTSRNYQVRGFKGTFGIIAAYTRTFCGSCNRIRVTPQGDLRTCLYAKESVNLRDIMRSSKNDDSLIQALKNAVGARAKDGFEAEKKRLKHPVSESMATIGG